MSLVMANFLSTYAEDTSWLGYVYVNVVICTCICFSKRPCSIASVHVHETSNLTLSVLPHSGDGVLCQRRGHEDALFVKVGHPAL